jgi:uncharacterized protein (DUF305 family)
MHTRYLLLAAAAAMALTAPVPAGAEGETDHSAMDHGAMDPAIMENPAVKGFMMANDTMHSDMAIAYTGNADVDFVRGMIPHHQGAIDMAKVVLEHGDDPEVRKLAEEIIKAQESEIAWMQEWLAKNGG